MSRIDYWHTTLPCMGTRKPAVKLRTEGYAMDRKLVRCYMRETGIHAAYSKPNLSMRNFKEVITPYLLRNKAISFPNQVSQVLDHMDDLSKRISALGTMVKGYMTEYETAMAAIDELPGIGRAVRRPSLRKSAQIGRVRKVDQECKRLLLFGPIPAYRYLTWQKPRDCCGCSFHARCHLPCAEVWRLHSRFRRRLLQLFSSGIQNPRLLEEIESAWLVT